ncbi:MAG: hypothetical protein R3C56_07170 [Pirellulaceae bacterium]
MIIPILHASTTWGKRSSGTTSFSEFIDGVNIRDLVEMEGPLSVDDAVYYTRQSGRGSAARLRSGM